MGHPLGEPRIDGRSVRAIDAGLGCGAGDRREGRARTDHRPQTGMEISEVIVAEDEALVGIEQREALRTALDRLDQLLLGNACRIEKLPAGGRGRAQAEKLLVRRSGLGLRHPADHSLGGVAPLPRPAPRPDMRHAGRPLLIIGHRCMAQFGDQAR